nr:MAG TPA: hypothetical protein [Caudoviricetes sp.]
MGINIVSTKFFKSIFLCYYTALSLKNTLKIQYLWLISI